MLAPGVGDNIDFVFHKVAEAADERRARGKWFLKKFPINPVVLVPVGFVGKITAHLDHVGKIQVGGVQHFFDIAIRAARFVFERVGNEFPVLIRRRHAGDENKIARANSRRKRQGTFDYARAVYGFEKSVHNILAAKERRELKA